MKNTERSPIFGTRLLRVGGRQVVGEERGRRGGDAHADDLEPLVLGCDERVPHRAAARALGDDRLERGRLGGRLDQHLAADRQPDGADALRIDVACAAAGMRPRRARRARPASRRGSDRPRSRPRRGGRRAARRSRGARASARAAACPSGRRTRSPRRRCATARTSPRAAGRRWSRTWTFSCGAPRFAAGTLPLAACVTT